MIVSAPAKINLNLRIQHRRPDGFHELETLMVPLKLSDRLEILIEPSRATEIHLTCDDPSLPVDAGNLIHQALTLFSRHTGRTAIYRVGLQKKIPAGAGLGGGSSNAAAALKTANSFFDNACSPEELRDLAARLGSDVPFFLGNGAAVGRGRGEILTPFELPFSCPVILVKPPFGVSTPWAYKTFAALREKNPRMEGQKSEFQSILLQNDLEPAVFSKYVFLEVLREALEALEDVTIARMSGSGSTIFGLLAEKMGDKQRQEELVYTVKERFGKSNWVTITGLSGT